MLLRTLFYELAAPLIPKTPHDCVQYVLFARRMSNRPSAEEKKISDPLENSLRVHPPESSFEPHPKVSQLVTEICDFFLDVHEDLDLFNLITGNLMQYLIHESIDLILNSRA